MKYIVGDLISLAKEGYFDVIVHGCNCFCTMGSGIARQIKESFPKVYLEDKKTPKGAPGKLGMFSYANIQLASGKHLTIVNAYTQFMYGYKNQHIQYDAVQKVFALILQKFHGKRIGYPKIGAGLGKGDWGIIKNIIDEQLAGEDHTCVVLQGDNHESILNHSS